MHAPATIESKHTSICICVKMYVSMYIDRLVGIHYKFWFIGLDGFFVVVQFSYYFKLFDITILHLDSVELECHWISCSFRNGIL